MFVTLSKNQNEAPFCPYQTHSHPNHLGSIVQQFSLGIKEHDDRQKVSLEDPETEDRHCAQH